MLSNKNKITFNRKNLRLQNNFRIKKFNQLQVIMINDYDYPRSAAKYKTLLQNINMATALYNTHKHAHRGAQGS